MKRGFKAELLVFGLCFITADVVREYSFVWNVPVVTGTYVVEVGLVPAQLTAYDAAWLKVT